MIYQATGTVMDAIVCGVFGMGVIISIALFIAEIVFRYRENKKHKQNQRNYFKSL